MKHQQNIIAGTLLAITCVFNLKAAAPDSANNIVINGDMEAWEPVKPNTSPRPVAKFPENVCLERFDSNVEVPDNDTSLPVGVSIAPDRLQKHGGDCSAKIENTEQEQTGAIGLRQIPVEPNTKYLVRVWIKGEDIAVDKDPRHGAVVWVKYGPEQDFWQSPLTASKLFVPETRDGTFPWTKFEFTFDTPEGIALLRVTLQLRRATGTVWFDDLEVIPVGKSEVSNF